MTQNATFQTRVLRARETYAESGFNQMIDFILVEKSRGLFAILISVGGLIVCVDALLIAGNGICLTGLLKI